MNVDLFDFELPKENIALRPMVPRDHARMLVVCPDGPDGMLKDARVDALADFLEPGDVLVFNNTRVIPGRLTGKRGDAKIQITLHKRASATVWDVFAKPAKKLRFGDVISFDGLSATVEAIGEDGERTLRFDVEPDQMTAALEQHGVMPLPPYIASQRSVDEQDQSDYQTMYAKSDGAVAAPTAGLHFTPNLMQKLERRGILKATVTLHVGAGTFLPVKVDNTKDHKMHSEWGEVTPETAAMLNEARRNGNRVVSVGTTSLRLLESAADDEGNVHPFEGDTAIFITPGYRFKVIDALMTNFHLPRSTLFMLVSAFSGFEAMQEAYGHAVKSNYRFYSYGDSSLLFPAKA